MIKEQILERLKDYSEAFYNKDFDRLIDYLYQEDITTARNMLQWAAKEMEPFGEAEGFLKLFPNISTSDELAQLTDKEFIGIYFSRMARAMSKKKVQEFVDTIIIEEIDHAEYIANVSYSFINVYSEQRERVSSEAQLIQSEGEWFVMFKPGMEQAFDRYRVEIDKYHKAAENDQPEKAAATPDDELRPHAVYGFKDYNDEVLITPRFREAKEFSEGLAAVKIFTKWGFINKKGEIVITPAYNRAESFDKKRAKVGNGFMSDDMMWGMIDEKGKVVVPIVYNQLGAFSEGMVAARLDGLWGFVDENGEEIVPFKYERVLPFKEGKAQCLYVHTDGNAWVLYVDKRGNEIGEVPEEEIEIYR